LQALGELIDQVVGLLEQAGYKLSAHALLEQDVTLHIIADHQFQFTKARAYRQFLGQLSTILLVCFCVSNTPRRRRKISLRFSRPEKPRV